MEMHISMIISNVKIRKIVRKCIWRKMIGNVWKKWENMWLLD